MRRFLIACVFVGSPAFADNWASWVGDWKATFAWRRCTAAGDRAPTVKVDAIDGAMHVDLSAAGAAMKDYTLVREDAAWVAQDGDVQVKLARNRIDIDFESGCTVRGKLVRASTGIAACDEMLGWARIEAACTKVEARLGALAMKPEKPTVAMCKAQAQKLEHAMIDAGCAPNPDPNIGTRAVECRSLVDATAKLQRCSNVPSDVTQRLRGIADQLSAASQTAEPSTLQYVERQCKDVRAEISAIAVKARCQL